jgi:16S rRNA (guanine1207-N2)-methyltransferase
VGSEHYFSAEPKAPARPARVEFTAAGRTFHLAAGSGVFSGGRLDPGTAVLLRKAPLPALSTEGVLLDLGCGYGPITCVLATVAPRATVYAVDVNARARALARTNANDAGVGDRVTVCAPDDVPDDIRFTEIWTNPPIRVGKPELQGLMRRWLPRLDAGGTAWLVVARHLGGDSLASWLAGPDWHGRFTVSRHASQKGFRVLRVTWAESAA